MAKNQGAMRMGPLSIFTFVVILCLATLTVLCVSTAQASLQMSKNQAESTTKTYDLESEGQAWMCLVSNGTLPDKACETAIEKNPDLEASSQIITTEEILTEMGKNIRINPEEYTSGVKAKLQIGDRMLNILLGLHSDGKYRVLNWKLSAELAEKEMNKNLWSGL